MPYYSNAENVPEFERLAREFHELATWLGEREIRRPTDADLAERLRAQLNSGWPLQLALQDLDLNKRRPRGRPRSGRRRVMLAMEHRELHPRVSWMRLAIRFCTCSASKHSEQCKE